MRFVTGGSCQGQTGWVMLNWQLGSEDMRSGESIRDEEILQVRAITDFHLLVRRWLQEGKTTEEMYELLMRNPDMVIINQEIGCGIVPVDPEERNLREVHGRLCCKLTKESEQVIRVICGIGQRIK